MADNVIVRVPEQQFIRGEDGYSPEVTIENINHGHSVTITDRDHPTGQSFNVMDGDSAYEQAVAGGYTGTEAQFNEELASFKELSDEMKEVAPFYAEYGVTTKAEIEAAINNKRQIYLNRGGGLGGVVAPYTGTFLYADIWGEGTGYRFARTNGNWQYVYELKSEWTYSIYDLTAPAQRAEEAAAAALTRMNSADQSAQNAASSASNASRDAGTASAAETTATEKAGEASNSATAADGSAKDSEAYAIGKRGGTDVGSTDPAYHNNAKYYAEQAASSASDAVTAKGAAETAQGKAEDAQEAAEQAQEAAEAVLESIPSDYTELTEDVDDLKSAFVADVGTITGNTPLVFSRGRYNTSTNTPATGSSVYYAESDTFVCAICPCQPGDIFSGHIIGYTGNSRAYFFCDSDMKLVAGGWAATNFELYGEVKAPANSAFVVFTNRLASLPDGYFAIKGTPLKNDVVDLQIATFSSTHASPLLFFVGGITGSDGTADNVTRRLRSFYFFPKDVQKITANDGYMISVFAWDSTGTYQGRIITDDTISTSGTIKTFTEFYPQRWALQHPNTLIRITLRRSDNAAMNIGEATNLNFETTNESIISLPTVTIPSDCATVFGWYDAFVTNGFATRELLTTVNSLPMYAYTISALTKYTIGDDDHVDNSGTEYERRKKILLFSGMHGNEKGAVMGLYQFIYNLCSNPDYKKYLAIFDFKIVPICNPTGFNLDTRNNYNDININRFDQAENEPECIAVKALIDSGIYDLFVDCHCSESSHDAETVNEPIGVMSFANGTESKKLVKYHNLYRSVSSDFENDMENIFSKDISNSQQLLFPWIGTLNQTARNYGYTHEVALPFTVVPRKFIRYTDGSIGTSSTGELLDGTGPISITGFNKIRYKRINTTSSTATNGIAFYDKDGVFVSGVPSVLGAGSYGYSWYEVDIPIGAATVRFSLFQNTETYGEFECYAFAGSNISACLETSNYCYGVSGSTNKENGSSAICAIKQTDYVLKTFIEYAIDA